jgi:hypothetical protein
MKNVAQSEAAFVRAPVWTPSAAVAEAGHGMFKTQGPSTLLLGRQAVHSEPQGGGPAGEAAAPSASTCTKIEQHPALLLLRAKSPDNRRRRQMGPCRRRLLLAIINLSN